MFHWGAHLQLLMAVSVNYDNLDKVRYNKHGN